MSTRISLPAYPARRCTFHFVLLGFEGGGMTISQPRRPPFPFRLYRFYPNICLAVVASYLSLNLVFCLSFTITGGLEITRGWLCSFLYVLDDHGDIGE